MKKHLIPIVFLFFLLIPIFNHFIQPGYFPMHDDTQVSRVITMGKALIQGQFPVRWVSELGYGYGYPLFNFYAPLPYYVGGLFYALGFTGLTATKLMFFIGVLAAAAGAYILGYRVWGKSGGILLAVLYSYAPYHAVQLFVRGAVGEYWATIFSPFIVLGLWSIYTKKGGKFFLLFGIAGTILSHTLSGLMSAILLFALFCVLFMVSYFLKKSIKEYLQVLIAVVCALGLTAFFWLPALTEMKYTNVQGQIGGTANYVDHYVCLKQLYYSPWGFGGSTNNCEDGLSFGLGMLFTGVSFIGSIGFFIIRKKQLFVFGILGAVITGVSLFLLLPYSRFIWDSLPPMAYIQYPWRFLSWTILGLSILSVGIVSFFSNKYARMTVCIVLSLLVIWRSYDVFKPQYTVSKPSEYYETVEQLRFYDSKVSDEYLSYDIKRPESLEDIPRQTFFSTSKYKIIPMIERDTFKKYEITSEQKAEIVANQAYFPGWVIRVNGKEQPIVLKNGFPAISVPIGYSTIELQFKNTIVRTISNLTSLIFMVVLIYKYGKKTIG